MKIEKEIRIVDAREGLLESITKDLIMFVFVGLLILISKDSVFWTLICAMTGLFVLAAKVNHFVKKRYVEAKSKADAISAVNAFFGEDE